MAQPTTKQDQLRAMRAENEERRQRNLKEVVAKLKVDIAAIPVLKPKKTKKKRA